VDLTADVADVADKKERESVAASMALSGTSDVARPVRRLPYPRNPRNPRSVFGTVRAGYSYLANSARVGQIGFTNNGNWRMTTTQAYDAVNRLTEVSSAPAGANAGTYCCAYDANGNVMGLVSAADGSVAARYEYGPFGELIRATGPMAKTNPFLFSTKYYDWETGLYYYGYRYYDPGTGRWVSRDPLGEAGGLNLYQYVYNSPLNYVDPDGLWGIQFGDFNIGWGDPNLAFDWDSWNDLGQGAAATADGLIPFFDPFKDKYDPCDPIFAYSYAGGEIAQNALLTAAGLRAAAWLGGTRLGHGLNHNPYLRIGPGRMPRNGPHPPSTGAPRISVGPQRPGVQNPHLDLRLWPFD